MNTTTFSFGQLSSSVETTSNSSFHLQETAGYVAYILVMFVILALGLLGNALTILVLYQPSHRNETLTPLMLNLAFAGLFITIFGYPMSTKAILKGEDFGADQTRCSWFGFVNGAVGITSIATFTEMTLVMTYSMHQMSPRYKFSRKVSFCLIVASWVYGVVTMLPPLLGWTRFVPGVAAVSCGPDWTDLSPSGMAYSLLLVAVGFFVPLSVISVCYFKIFRYVSFPATPDKRLKVRNSSQKNLSVDCRPFVGRQTADSQPIVDCLSADCWPLSFHCNGLCLIPLFYIYKNTAWRNCQWTAGNLSAAGQLTDSQQRGAVLHNYHK